MEYPSQDLGLESSPKNYHREELINELNELQESFKDQNHDIIDMETGQRILNGDVKHLWFRDNIALYFATGKIFDDKDKELLTNILSYFDNSKRTYLGNFYKVLNYKDIVIQGFEKKLNIGNGNYHFILIVISYPLLDDIQFSPEPKFMNRGVVEYFVDTSRVKERMIEFIREYGLTAELEKDFENAPPVTINNSFTHKDIQFDIRDDIDTDLMETQLKIPERVRKTASLRGKQLGYDHRNVVPLNKRIQPKGSDVLSLPIIKRAAYSRTTDTLQIDKNQKTYQIYDNDNDFIMKVMT